VQLGHWPRGRKRGCGFRPAVRSVEKETSAVYSSFREKKRKKEGTNGPALAKSGDRRGKGSLEGTFVGATRPAFKIGKVLPQHPAYEEEKKKKKKRGGSCFPRPISKGVQLDSRCCWQHPTVEQKRMPIFPEEGGERKGKGEDHTRCSHPEKKGCGGPTANGSPSVRKEASCRRQDEKKREKKEEDLETSLAGEKWGGAGD